MENIINVRADIHSDGDVYVYNPKTKKYERIGILIDDNIRRFLFDDKGDLISAPAINPCFKKVQKIKK